MNKVNVFVPPSGGNRESVIAIGKRLLIRKAAIGQSFWGWNLMKSEWMETTGVSGSPIS